MISQFRSLHDHVQLWSLSPKTLWSIKANRFFQSWCNWRDSHQNSFPKYTRMTRCTELLISPSLFVVSIPVSTMNTSVRNEWIRRDMYTELSSLWPQVLEILLHHECGSVLTRSSKYFLTFTWTTVIRMWIPDLSVQFFFLIGIVFVREICLSGMNMVWLCIERTRFFDTVPSRSFSPENYVSWHHHPSTFSDPPVPQCHWSNFMVVKTVGGPDLVEVEECYRCQDHRWTWKCIRSPPYVQTPLCCFQPQVTVSWSDPPLFPPVCPWLVYYESIKRDLKIRSIY